MFAGYVLLAIPMATNIGLYSMFGALALIALGTGLFKGNLQVMVGNLYDAPEPDGKNSWYWDSPENPAYRYETFVTSELVKYTCLLYTSTTAELLLCTCSISVSASTDDL